MKTKTKKKGFTLVEILIVVVILGILAAIVIPQFGDASAQANESNLKTQLQTYRAQIQLYHIQHSNAYPGELGTEADFVADMTVAAGGYGPYFRPTQQPVNPFNGLSTIDVDGTLGGGSHGWYYDSTTGVISPDTAAHIAW